MSNLKPSIANKIIDEKGNVYNSVSQLAKELNIDKNVILRKLRKNTPYTRNGHTYKLKDVMYVGFDDETDYSKDEKTTKDVVYSDEYKEFLKTKNVSELPFEKYEFKLSNNKNGSRYAVALFSDAHIEETVSPNSVLGLNEYNLNIAEKRIERYFVNLARTINEDNVDDLIFASLGDTITGFIHDEYNETNSLTPLEATFKAQSLIYSGLEYLVENTNLKKIKFIGIVGNHSRTTKKMQHSNGYKMSYEWLMYKNIEKQCQLTDLPIEFYIPESEMAIVETSDSKRFIFIHGFQIKGGSGISGILPSLNKMVLKWERVFHQDKVYLGHFHNFMNLGHVAVNSSIIGYNSFALSNGMLYEKPCQLYELYDTVNGDVLSRKIYCE